MKKLTFIILLAFVSIISATAQEADSPQTKHNDVVVDDLISKMSKLQRDFDYLTCDFELTKLEHELTSFCNEINIKSNALLTNHYNSSFSYDLYMAYKNNYNASLDKAESLKRKASSVKVLVTLKTIGSNFSEEETNLISMRCEALDTQFSVMDSALKYYKVVLELY